MYSIWLTPTSGSRCFDHEGDLYLVTRQQPLCGPRESLSTRKPAMYRTNLQSHGWRKPFLMWTFHSVGKYKEEVNTLSVVHSDPLTCLQEAPRFTSHSSDGVNVSLTSCRPLFVPCHWLATCPSCSLLSAWSWNRLQLPVTLNEAWKWLERRWKHTCQENYDDVTRWYHLTESSFPPFKWRVFASRDTACETIESQQRFRSDE